MSIQSTPADFELSRKGDQWMAVHVETGVASQEETPAEAVDMAQDAARLQQASHEPGDDAHQRAMVDRYDIDEVVDSIETPEGMP